MKRLVANFKGKEYPLEDGVIFKNEYNEQLDSGTIIIPHAPKLDIAPFDDIYIYPNGETFNGVNTKYSVLWRTIKHLESIEFDTLSVAPLGQELATVDVVSQSSYIFLTPNFTTIENMPISELLNKSYFYKNNVGIPQDHTDKLFNIGDIWLGYKDDLNVERTLELFSVDYDDNGVKLSFKVGVSPLNPTLIGRVVEFDGQTSIMIEKPSNFMTFTQSKGMELSYLKKAYKITFNFDDEHFDYEMVGTLQGYWLNQKVSYTMETFTPTEFRAFGIDKQVNHTDTQVNLIYEYDFTKGVDLAFANLGVEQELQARQIMLTPKINEPEYLKHLVVDSFIETQLDTEGKYFEYKITLFSETKLLETIAITQKTFTSDFVGFETQGGVWTLLERLVKLYSPKIKIQDSKYTWTHIDEFVLDKDLLKPLFENIPIPDFTFEKTNLREVLTQLFLMRDMIPVVKHRVITGFDITKRGKKIVNTQENLPLRLQSSDDYSTALITPHEQSISTKQATKSIEYIGFRNHEKGLMKLEDLELVFSKPIQKIDKIYMCYYKRFEIRDKNNTLLGNKVVMIKQDITPIVVLQGTANILSEDFYDLHETNPPNTIEELQKYKPCVIGYEIGSNVIKGWGTKYTWQKNTWWNNAEIYLHNIWKWFDNKYPAGINGISYIVDNFTNEWAYPKSNGNLYSDHNVISPYRSDIQDNKIKGIFFQVEYTSFFEGATKHTKDKLVKEYQAIDNPSSSISWLDKVGSFQKEKLNRFANAIQVRTAIHRDMSEVYELGDYDDDDYIVFSIEKSIDAGSITANYKLIKDHVLKDYYTNVNTRLRPFALLSYEDSVMRKENRTSYLYFSSNECYFENVDNFIESEMPILDLFLSGFEPNERKEYIDYTNYPQTINFSYFEVGGKKYLSQFSKEAIGNSLVFNAVLPDNVSAGSYIVGEHLDEFIDENTIGTPQSWYMLTDEMGFVDIIGFYFSHIETQEVFGTTPYIDDSGDTTSDIYYHHLLPMPKLTYTPQETNVIGKDYSFYKDNRETISFTSQFEYISELDNVLISNRFLELNDLLNEREYKTDITHSVSNALNLGGAGFNLATWSVSNENWTDAKMNNMPVLWATISDIDLVNDITTPITIKLKAPDYYDWDARINLEGYLILTIDDFEKVDNNTFKAQVKHIKGQATRLGIVPKVYSYNTPPNELIGEIMFYRNGTIPNQYEVITLDTFSNDTFVCPLGAFTYRVKIDNKVEDFTFHNVKSLFTPLGFYKQFYATYNVEYDSGYLQFETHPTSFGDNVELKVFHQNMFVYKIGDIDIRQLKDLRLTFNTINSMFDNYGINATPSTIFDYGIDEYGRAFIDAPEPSVFYFRERASGSGSDKMSFCFANLNNKTFVSLLTSKDQRVYSPYLVHIGTNKNYAFTTDTIRHEQYIDFFDNY